MRLFATLCACLAAVAVSEPTNEAVFDTQLPMTEEQLAQLVSEANVAEKTTWPAPEGLPRGWHEGADVTRSGPFLNTLYFAAPYDPRVIVYYPRNLGANGARHPVVFFHPGYLFASSTYPGVVNRLVSHGFLVVADDRCGLNVLCSPPQMARNVRQTIEWFITDVTRNPRQPQNITRANVDISRCGMSGHSMGGGTTVLVLNEWAVPDHPLRGREPEFRMRGGAAMQPWHNILEPLVPKTTLAPLHIAGGTLDLLVPPSMYRRLHERSSDLKLMIEFIAGHTEPALDGGRYVAPLVDFFYASLLGDAQRWYRLFPRTAPAVA